MLDILQKIPAVKAEEVVVTRKHHDLASVRAEVEANRTDSTPGVRGFVRAIRGKIVTDNTAVIAEVKKASPSKDVLCSNSGSADIIRSYAEHGVACLSMLTDEQPFQDHADYLREVRAACTLLVLRKGLMVDLYRVCGARSWGMDCILLTVAVLDQDLIEELETYALELGLDVPVEIYDGHEPDRALRPQTPLMGANNHDLRMSEASLDNMLGLLKYISDDRIVIMESDILTPDDVRKMCAAVANVFFVGEAFMCIDDPGAELTRLFA